MMDADNQTRFRQLLQTMFTHDETGKLVPSPTYQKDAQTLSALVKTIPRITEITLHAQVARFGGFGVYRASLHDSTGQVREARDDYLLLGEVHPPITLPFHTISWVAAGPLIGVATVPRDTNASEAVIAHIQMRLENMTWLLAAATQLIPHVEGALEEEARAWQRYREEQEPALQAMTAQIEMALAALRADDHSAGLV